MISTPYSEDVHFIGPPLEDGPMPTLFYFSLSAKTSLEQDPFNQPVQFLEGTPIRIFSVTLPAHENNLPPENAMDVWEERMKGGDLVIPPFIEKLKGIVNELKPHIKGGNLIAAGLSRGAYIACHLAAVCPEITHLLGFAPLTRFRAAKELDLEILVPSLYNRTIRFYIGNHDTRVGTDHAFSFIDHLAKEAHKHRIRSSPIELIVGPSIGYQGHGTSPKVFKEGAAWVKEVLL
jgi:predicted esterase